MAKLATFIAGITENRGTVLARTGMVFLLALIFFVAGGGISQNPNFAISRIDIVGTQAVSSDEVLAFVEERIKGNYFFVYARDNSRIFPKHEIEEGLLEVLPRISNAVALRMDPHTIRIEVTERKPYALWCGTKFHPELSSYPECWFVDEAGFVFDRAPIFSPGVYVEMYGKIDGGEEGNPLRTHVSPVAFSLMSGAVQNLKRDIGNVARVEAKEGGEYSLVIEKSTQYPMLASVEIRFTDDMTPERLVKNILTTLPVQFPENAVVKKSSTAQNTAKRLLYIDMRYGNKIFFGFDK